MVQYENHTIIALCQCAQYDFPALRERMASEGEVTISHNVLHLFWQDGEVFIFAYGVVVFWGVNEVDRHAPVSMLGEFSEQPLQESLTDELSFELGQSPASLKNDHVSLPADDMLLRLAVSHGIAQSTKLAQYEAGVQFTISSTEHIPQSIATTGKSGLGRKALAKLRGQLYLTKSNVMLHYDLLDVPEFFWENAELQPYYVMVADYLEIKPRIEVLNKKLETIQDLLAMIADEQKHAHSSLLEWIIIWLIAIDIVIILWQEYLH